jgi:hypothetical protein
MPVGAVDQFVDSTDALGSEPLCRAAMAAADRLDALPLS